MKHTRITNNQRTKQRFQNVIFDADSTLFTIEGIDELARMKGVYPQVAALTAVGMNGHASFEKIMVERLKIIQPNAFNLKQLAGLYQQSITAGGIELIHALIKQKINVFVVSGGFTPALRMGTKMLNVKPELVFANELVFNEKSAAQLNSAIPLWKNTGKQEIVAGLRKKYSGTFLMIGDGKTDWDVYEAGLVEEFILFAGVVKREKLLAKARKVIFEKNLLRVLQFL